MKAWKWFLLLLGSLALLGCGPDCAAMCEDAKKCEGADQAVDCEKSCEDAEKTAEGAGCERQYEAALDCTDNHQENTCTADESCKKELEALTTCIAK